MTEPTPTAHPDSSLDQTLDRVAGALRRAREEFSFEARVERFGRVVSVGAGVAVVAGLTGVRGEELLRFENGGLGMAFNVEERTCGVVLLDKGEALSAGELVRRIGRVADTPVGDGLAGRIVNALGVPLDGRGPLRHSGGGRRVPVERPAPAIMDRSPVTEPLRTGLKVVDALIPVGLGQRELILGDRQSGKTAIALDAIINQRGRNVACFYCAVGQRASSVAKVVAALVAGGAMDHTTVVVATEEDPPGLRFLTPYAATSMAEEVMARGGDALVVYDDLTRHARAYREMSLLLRRPPGREAFPGDIFYIHSRLLERATHLTDDMGGGSLTALPIVETEAQNISAYIPTNLISITDGQIYLSPVLFHKGVLPAVDVGRSVSRVGGNAQLPAYRAVVGDLRLAYSQFEELESFSRFGTRLDEETRKRLERGRRVREVLKQPRLKPLTTAEQVFVLVALIRGVFDSRDPEGLDQDQEVVLTALNQGMPDVARVVEEGGGLSPDDLERIADTARRALGLSAGPAAGEEGR